MHHPSEDVGQAEIAPRIAIRQLLVIEPQLVQNGRMQIVHVHLARDRLMAELIGFAKRQARPETATGQPDGEA